MAHFKINSQINLMLATGSKPIYLPLKLSKPPLFGRQSLVEADKAKYCIFPGILNLFSIIFPGRSIKCYLPLLIRVIRLVN